MISHEGQLVAVSLIYSAGTNGHGHVKTVRYCTVGDMTYTAAVESGASTIDDIINKYKDTHERTR